MFSPKGWVRPARKNSWNLQRHQRENCLQNKISALPSKLSHPLSYQAARKVRTNWECPSNLRPDNKTKDLRKRRPPFSSVYVTPLVPNLHQQLLTTTAAQLNDIKLPSRLPPYQPGHPAFVSITNFILLVHTKELNAFMKARKETWKKRTETSGAREAHRCSCSSLRGDKSVMSLVNTTWVLKAGINLNIALALTVRLCHASISSRALVFYISGTGSDISQQRITWLHIALEI